MGRGTRNYAEHRGGKGYRQNNARGSRDGSWSPVHPDDDPFRDLRAPADDLTDPVYDDYVWPEFDNEDDD